MSTQALSRLKRGGGGVGSTWQHLAPKRGLGAARDLSMPQGADIKVEALGGMPQLHHDYAGLAVTPVEGAPRIQAKLTISESDDDEEREANRAADTVMRMPGPPAQEQGEKNANQALRHSSGMPKERPQLEPELTSAIQEIQGQGAPLARSIRAFMEPRFGNDFSGVRVHTAPHAAELAKGLGARAFTVGRDVVFGASEYRPEATEGRRLLAHELAHVVQQDSACSQGSGRGRTGSVYLSAARENCQRRLVQEYYRNKILQFLDAAHQHSPKQSCDVFDFAWYTLHPENPWAAFGDDVLTKESHRNLLIQYGKDIRAAGVLRHQPTNDQANIDTFIRFYDLVLFQQESPYSRRKKNSNSAREGYNLKTDEQSEKIYTVICYIDRLLKIRSYIEKPRSFVWGYLNEAQKAKILEQINIFKQTVERALSRNPKLLGIYRKVWTLYGFVWTKVADWVWYITKLSKIAFNIYRQVDITDRINVHLQLACEYCIRLYEYLRRTQRHIANNLLLDYMRDIILGKVRADFAGVPAMVDILASNVKAHVVRGLRIFSREFIPVSNELMKDFVAVWSKTMAQTVSLVAKKTRSPVLHRMAGVLQVVDFAVFLLQLTNGEWNSILKFIDYITGNDKWTDTPENRERLSETIIALAPKRRILTINTVIYSFFGQ